MGGAASDYRSTLAEVPRLVSIPGQVPREFRFLIDDFVIGSDPGADFVLEDPTVSARHARIRKHGGRWMVSDLGSTNGTLVNGNRIARETALARADNLRLGIVQFTFLEPAAASAPPRRRVRIPVAIQGLIALVLIGTAAYVLYTSLDQWLTRPRIPRARPTPAMGDTWIGRLNYYRLISGLPIVREDAELSQADLAHARYLVRNEAGAIRAGRPGASMHTEDPARPLYTPEGKNAAAISAVDAVFTDPPEDPGRTWAIDNWITGPFHRMWLLNPDLARAGYGQVCGGGVCAAALNVQSGIAARAADAAAPAPVMFPPDQATIHNGAFTADESEWPDPLAPCEGYENPTGIPITLELGRPAPMVLEEYRIESNGAAVPACGFDADTYRSRDHVANARVRRELAHFGAVVIVPRRPLTPGGVHTVTLKASGKVYSWWFAVAP